jgi:hypothetical protein
MTTDKNEDGRVTDGRIEEILRTHRDGVYYTCLGPPITYTEIEQMASELQRLRALDVEPRPLRESDEYVAMTVRSNLGPQFEATHRIIRIPIPSAAEPEEPKRPKPTTIEQVLADLRALRVEVAELRKELLK